MIAEWIGAPGSGGQLDDYTRKTAHRNRMHRTTLRLGRACLWTSMAISVLLALFQHRLGPDNTTMLVAVMGCSRSPLPRASPTRISRVARN
ncbi:hypothetical protein [Dokdonella soli]|uniref:hypothetical protein n=1 Tax=Dokdonella soli TaxID=529810 RepID=UPI0036D42E08